MAASLFSTLSVLQLLGVSVVDHSVLFKMPDLISDKQSEEQVLGSLNQLKSFPGLNGSFVSGRLLKEVDGFTHGLFARFQDQASLTQYYDSPGFEVAVLPQFPYLQAETSVDYYTNVIKNSSQFLPGEVLHVCFFRLKPEADESEMNQVYNALLGLVERLPSIVIEVTAGANLYDRNFDYSDAFLVRLTSESVVDPVYEKIKVKLKINSLFLITADFKDYFDSNHS